MKLIKKSISIFLVLVLTLSIAPIVDFAPKANATTYVTVNGHTVVDKISFNGAVTEAVYTAFYGDGYNSDTTYCCAAFVKRFYLNSYGINVWNLTYQKTPLTDNGSFSVTTSPKVGDIVRRDSKTHWMIVKAVSGSTVTLIEQNFWSSPYAKAPVNRTISTSDSDYTFFRYSKAVDGGGSSSSVSFNATVDTAVDGVTVDKAVTPYFNVRGWAYCSDKSDTTVYWCIDDKEAYAANKNEREDVVKAHGCRLDCGFDFSVPVKDLSVGQHKLSLWVKSSSGSADIKAAYFNVTNSDSTAPVIKDVAFSNELDNFLVTCGISDDYGVSKVDFAVWTAYNGQDDLKIHTGNISGDGYAWCVINSSDHNYEIGTYYVDIYSYDNANNRTIAGTYEVYVGNMIVLHGITNADGSDAYIDINGTPTITGERRFWFYNYNLDPNYYINVYVDDKIVLDHVQSDGGRYVSYVVDTGTLSDGKHTIKAELADSNGAYSYTKEFYVDNLISFVGISNTVNNGWIDTSGTPSISGIRKIWFKKESSDSNYYIDMYVDGIKVESMKAVDAEGYYSYTVNTSKLTNGAHTFRAELFDSKSYYTATKTVIVDNGNFILDVNPLLNNTMCANGIDGITFDVYLNGSLVADDVSDFYSESVVHGTEYEIKDIKCPYGYVYDSGNTSGVVNDRVEARLYFKSTGNFDINMVVNDTVYMSGLDGFTFDLYLDGVLEKDNGTDYHTSSMPKGTKYVINDIKCPDGYVYTGGSVSGTVNEAVDIRLTFSSVMNVEFQSFSESSTDGKTVTYGTIYGSLPTPERIGYIFDGWHTQAEGGTKVTSATKVINTTNHTLYAHWKTQTAYFDLNYEGTAVNYFRPYENNVEGYYFDRSNESIVLDGTFESGKTLAFMPLSLKEGDTVKITTDVSFAEMSSGFVVLEAVDSSLSNMDSDKYGNVRLNVDFRGDNTRTWKITKEQASGISMLRLWVWGTDNKPISFDSFFGKITVEVIPAGKNSATVISAPALIITNGKSYDYSIKSGTLPTPTREGYTFDGWYTAASGGTKITADTKVTATGDQTLYAHWTCKHSKYTSTVTKEATCTVDGVKTYTCATCSHTYTESIPATKHNYKSVVTAPTCTAEGYTTFTCEKCGDTYTDNKVSATGHSFGGWKVTAEATCTKAGLKEKVCACGEKETEEIPATKHNYKSVVTAPTCTAEGYTTYTCEKCGDTYKGDKVSATGHSFGGWKVTAEATCTKAGLKEKVCACGEKETEEIPATKHNYKSVVTAPTCTTEGYTTFTCEKCGDTYKGDKVSATGHSFGGWKVTAEATCTKAGLKEKVCACGEKETEEIPAKGHSFGKWGVKYTATCQDEGLEERVCSCGETETRTIAKTSHSDRDNDGYCDECYEKTGNASTGNNNCSHLCHSKNAFIAKLIWPIVRFFIKLFGTNPVCTCGASHY